MHAYRTMLERMVLFDCTVCRELFPPFHPAYDPTERVELQLFRRGPRNVAALNLEVADWDEVPPLEATGEELLVASVYEGTCWACHMEIKGQMETPGSNADCVVPRRSHLNRMNPMYRFLSGGVGHV